MIVIGERINATRKPIARAIEEKNAAHIRREALRQIEAGAFYLDLNAGLGRGREKEDLVWLISVVQETAEPPLCLDSSDPEVLEACLPLVKNPDVMVNSITGESARIARLTPVIKSHPGAKVIALTMDDAGIPADTDRRLVIAERLIDILGSCGVAQEDIFLDGLVQPVSTDVRNARIFLEFVKEVKRRHPQVRTTCGLSNVSFGLPKRSLVNRHFLVLACAAGLDSAICDPTEEGMMSSACVTEMLLGRDEFCMQYIRSVREGRQ